MAERNTKRRIYRFLISAVLAGELAVLADIAVVLLYHSLPVSAFLLMAAGLWLCFYTMPWFTRKNLTIAAASVLGLVALTGTVGMLVWQQFGTWAAYQKVDSGKQAVYAERRVMVIVPHQDDELNILGGVMEEYVNYGSEVYPVFATNGDYYGIAQTRFQEAVDVCANIGIPKENVIFMGYGDGWSKDGPHLYNAEPGVVRTSQNGKTETYGTAVQGVFREGRAYTIDNFLEDMQDVILAYRPDVIFCSDYDTHKDHRALSLAFEKVMGKLLKENPDYRPQVFKGYAYLSAWYAQPDFYEVNLTSTGNVFEEPYYQYPKVYRWEDRVRFPVDAATLSRSLLNSKAYETLRLHLSQEAQYQAASVVNGDKVFWYRDTNSLCHLAEIAVSSSDGTLLNDFMLTENHNLVDTEHLPFDGVWIPEADDEEKSATVTFAEPSDVRSIVLYDHPSEEHNVTDAVIVFDDGTQLRTGPLDPYGAATEIPVEKGNVTSFRVCLVVTEGENAGLSEIEAFANKPEADMKLLKIVDLRDNFVYDYWLPKDGSARFGFYTYGNVPAVSADNYQVACDNDSCSAEIKNGKLEVSCPVGETATITVTCNDGTLSESIFVQNPGWMERTQCILSQKAEGVLFVGYCNGRHWQLATVKVLDILRDFAGTYLK